MPSFINSKGSTILLISQRLFGTESSNSCTFKSQKGTTVLSETQCGEILNQVPGPTEQPHELSVSFMYSLVQKMSGNLNWLQGKI